MEHTIKGKRHKDKKCPQICYGYKYVEEMCAECVDIIVLHKCDPNCPYVNCSTKCKGELPLLARLAKKQT